ETRDTLRVEDACGNLLALLISHASFIPSLKEKLEVLKAELQIAFPGELYSVDTASDQLFKFLALHFTWYNKFSESGAGAPDDIHPNQLLKDGSLKVNWGQRQPRESQQIRDHPALYKQVTDIMEDILIFVRGNIRHHLPQAYEELEIHCDFLPYSTPSPVHPFTSMVINLCACTKGHRDHGDKKWCATFTLGDFEGGEICFHESGLVFDSRPGDILVFRSQDETHFNLHVKGTRSTIVFHSDRTMDSWVDNYNRWTP
ncbi:hypothetical protein FIBSPDRAFT_702759, partial [Athelia psychrophila]